MPGANEKSMYEQEILELENMLRIYVADPKTGNSMSMTRWGRQTASLYGIKEELSVARNRLRSLDSGNPLANNSRTDQITGKSGGRQQPQSTKSSSFSDMLTEMPLVIIGIILAALFIGLLINKWNGYWPFT